MPEPSRSMSASPEPPHDELEHWPTPTQVPATVQASPDGATGGVVTKVDDHDDPVDTASTTVVGPGVNVPGGPSVHSCWVPVARHHEVRQLTALSVDPESPLSLPDGRAKLTVDHDEPCQVAANASPPKVMVLAPEPPSVPTATQRDALEQETASGWLPIAPVDQREPFHVPAYPLTTLVGSPSTNVTPSVSTVAAQKREVGQLTPESWSWTSKPDAAGLVGAAISCQVDPFHVSATGTLTTTPYGPLESASPTAMQNRSEEQLTPSSEAKVGGLVSANGVTLHVRLR